MAVPCRARARHEVDQVRQHAGRGRRGSDAVDVDVAGEPLGGPFGGGGVAFGGAPGDLHGYSSGFWSGVGVSASRQTPTSTMAWPMRKEAASEHSTARLTEVGHGRDGTALVHGLVPVGSADLTGVV